MQDWIIPGTDRPVDSHTNLTAVLPPKERTISFGRVRSINTHCYASPESSPLQVLSQHTKPHFGCLPAVGPETTPWQHATTEGARVPIGPVTRKLTRHQPNNAGKRSAMLGATIGIEVEGAPRYALGRG